MISTLFLAKYFGILMLALGLVILFRHRLISQWVRKALLKPSVFFLTGVFEFMIGLLIVLGHQKWGSFTAGLVSVVGWLMLIESALYITLPKASLVHMVGKMDNATMVQATAIVSIGLGATLALLGFQIM
ncbi:MAG: hypothetical protein BRC25_01160 [Parcubacteria group bacterium SW_6_46_9]|nr:MAG: hypothetical protein BRC25_01160 [Parcubacteria group bacterium SW_6_46_9]